ncbi:PepSY-associated TM helix domain-containing protein [Mycolicibacterium sp. Y3]
MTLPEEISVPENPTAPPPPRRSWRPLLMRLHFYAGILVAPFIVVAAVTGGLYAMAPTIERLAYGDLLRVEPSGRPVPLADQAAAARNAYPHLAMTGMRPSAETGESTRIYFADPALDEEFRRAVFVDPYTARVLGDEPTWLGYLPVSTFLDGLHRHLQLGEPGRIYSEVAASWLWVVALGGLCLWLFRRSRVFTVARGLKGRARTLNWHGATGVWLLAGLLFLSATGITWSTYAGAHVSDIRTALNWQRPTMDPAPTSTATVDPAGIDYDAVVHAAAGAGVRLPVEVALAPEAGAGVTVTEQDKPYRLTTNAATVDPATGSVISTLDYWRDYSVVAMLADWGIRAHMGLLFGLLNQLVLLGIAVALVAVIVGGYRMWWLRRPTRGSAWAVGRAPLRGGLRKLSPWAAGTLVVIAVALGWFLPLFGIPLAAFVIVDLGIAAITRGKAGSDA